VKKRELALYKATRAESQDEVLCVGRAGIARDVGSIPTGGGYCMPLVV
jgi:hypothetical protein